MLLSKKTLLTSVCMRKAQDLGKGEQEKWLTSS